jgi:triacylglycerol esterase/lipase EstA (alpha/beta hydrolase family)
MSDMSYIRRLGASVAAAALLLAAPATALAAETPDTGPDLSVNQGALDKSLACTPGDPAKTPVLLIPGTTVEPEENFGWNYEQAFLLEKRPFCAVTLPNRSMADIQVAAEYVVNAIRTMHENSGGKISIVGHSQGGMIGRWALKYWPDTRDMIDDLIGLAPSNHGTLVADVACDPDCAPAIWQQRQDSAFMEALNTGPETWPGISYTVIYSPTDGVIVPADLSKLETGDGAIANIALNEACYDHVADHLTLGTSDPVAYALAADALSHPGPASLASFDRLACNAFFQPGVNKEFFPVNGGRAFAAVVATLLLTEHVPAEPALAGYAKQ